MVVNVGLAIGFGNKSQGKAMPIQCFRITLFPFTFIQSMGRRKIVYNPIVVISETNKAKQQCQQTMP